MNLKVGDTVRLKSGGPLMTVRSIDSDGRVWCDYFVKGENQTTGFYKDQLIPDED